MRSKDLKPATRLVDVNSGMFSLSPDGSVNWPRTIRLAQFAAGDGVERAVVIATQSCIEVLQRRISQLSALLVQRQIRLQVTAAVELTIQNDLFEQVAQTAAIFRGPLSRYVFLRVPSDTILPITPIIQTLDKRNLTAILLAPERCARFQENVSELRQIVSSGGLLQLSAASLSDQTDRSRIKLCRHLIRKDLCHFVASESGRHHDLPISLGEAFQTTVRWAGTELAEKVFLHNANCVFDGRAIEATRAGHGMMKNFSRAG